MKEQGPQVSSIKSQIYKQQVLFIVGPTASGKSSVAMEIARKYRGEIICADSQTVRSDLDIGTAKPSKEDRSEIPHHMLDVIEPYAEFSVTQFQTMAQESISAILDRGNLPIVVGGTGLYIDSLFFNYDLETETKNDTYKPELQNKTVEELQELIREKGYTLPENKGNPRHLIGVLLRQNRNNKNVEPIENAYIFGLLPEDDELKKRIHSRAESMFEQGFLDEVTAVIEKYGDPPKRLDAIGYPLAARYIHGEVSLDKMKELFKRGHWQYVRRQKSWFKRNPYIKWSSTSDNLIKDIEHVLQT